mgnify:CR=1 FL=1
MTILHVISGLGAGGAEGVLFRLLTADFSNRHAVVSLTSSGIYGDKLRLQGIQVFELRMNRIQGLFMAIPRLVMIVRAVDPDAVQTWMYHADLIGGVVAKLLGVPRIFWGIRRS